MALEFAGNQRLQLTVTQPACVDQGANPITFYVEALDAAGFAGATTDGDCSWATNNAGKSRRGLIRSSPGTGCCSSPAGTLSSKSERVKINITALVGAQHFAATPTRPSGCA